MTQAAKDTQASLFTLDELSGRTGESADRLSEWQALGLVGTPGSDSFGLNDVARAQMIRDLLRLGVTVEAIAEAADRKDPEFQRWVGCGEEVFDQACYSVGHPARGPPGESPAGSRAPRRSPRSRAGSTRCHRGAST